MNKTTTALMGTLWGAAILFLVGKDTWPVSEATLKTIDFSIACILITSLSFTLIETAMKVKTIPQKILSSVPSRLPISIFCLCLLICFGIWLAMSAQSGNTIIGTSLGSLLAGFAASWIALAFVKKSK